jgi:hypothetical protein
MNDIIKKPQAQPLKTPSIGNVPQKQPSSPRKKTSINSLLFGRDLRLVALVVGILAVIGIFGLQKFNTAGVNKGSYQLVSLANGQAYIGKLTNSPTSGFLHLKEVYTIQSGATSATDQSNSQPQLVKLRDQLAGSEDEIYLNKDQVVFWENLRSDSKVTKAIQEANK